MWETALSYRYSTDLFLQLFHALTARLVVKHNNQLLGAPLAAVVWHYIEQGRRTKHGVTRSLLEMVLCSSTAQMLSLVLYYGIEVNPVDMPGVALNTILHNWGHERCESERYNTEKVRILIEAGAIMCPYPSDGPSLLQLAVDVDKTWNAELVRLILDTDEVHGINAESAFGDRGAIVTPLEQIVTMECNNMRDDNRTDITTQLVESGAVYTRMTHSGASVLSLALKRELDASEDAYRISMLDVLLTHMTPSEVRMPATTSHGSLVMQAVAKGGRKYDRPTSVVLAKLLARGADASAVDGPSGQTPLYYMVAQSLRPGSYSPSRVEDNEKAVVQLLQGGADIFRENADGKNVVDLVAAQPSNWTMKKDTYQLLYDTAMRRQNNLEAFGMALHPHVGAMSKVSVLPPEMMHKIMNGTYFSVLPSVQDMFP
jgi:hypothetical protein